MLDFEGKPGLEGYMILNGLLADTKVPFPPGAVIIGRLAQRIPWWGYTFPPEDLKMAGAKTKLPRCYILSTGLTIMRRVRSARCTR